MTHRIERVFGQTAGWDLVYCSCGATFQCEPNWTIREAYEAHLRAARKADADK